MVNAADILIASYLLLLVLLCLIIYLSKYQDQQHPKRVLSQFKDFFSPREEAPEYISVFKKSWRVGSGNILGSIELSCSGENMIESIKGIQSLLELSKEHDSYCFEKKEIEKDISVG